MGNRRQHKAPPAQQPSVVHIFSCTRNVVIYIRVQSMDCNVIILICNWYSLEKQIEIGEEAARVCVCAHAHIRSHRRRLDVRAVGGHADGASQCSNPETL